MREVIGSCKDSVSWECIKEKAYYSIGLVGRASWGCHGFTGFPIIVV